MVDIDAEQGFEFTKKKMKRMEELFPKLTKEAFRAIEQVKEKKARFSGFFKGALKATPMQENKENDLEKVKSSLSSFGVKAGGTAAPLKKQNTIIGKSK